MQPPTKTYTIAGQTKDDINDYLIETSKNLEQFSCKKKEF